MSAASASTARRLRFARSHFRYLRRVAYWLAVAASSVVLAAILASVGARFFGYSPYVLYGGSMGWTAPIGSVAIENVPAESLKVGDVIVFRPPSSGAPRQLVMHRIISLEQIEGQRVFGTKGDANQGPDPWKLTIGGDGGRLAYVVPYMGYLLWLFQTRMRWVFVSLPLVAYLGFAALRRIWVPAPSGDTPRVQV